MDESKKSRLETLLGLSTLHLNEKQESRKDDGAFLLQRLVPIHTSLLEATRKLVLDGATNNPGANGSPSIDSLQRNYNDGNEIMREAITIGTNYEDERKLDWLKAFLENQKNSRNNDKCDDDLVLCHRVLWCESYGNSGNGIASADVNDRHDNDRKKLLIWQYLLQRARDDDNRSTPSSSTSMEWLSLVLYHYIFPSQQQQQGIHHAPVSDNLLHVLLELSLDWVLEDEIKEKPEILEKREANWYTLRKKLLKESEKSIATTNNGSESLKSIPLSSKIVANIVLKYLAREQHEDNHNHLLPFLLSMYYEHLWVNLKFCCNCSNANQTNSNKVTRVEFLSDVSKTMLLPILDKFESHEEAIVTLSLPSMKHQAHYCELEKILRERLFPLLEQEGVLVGQMGKQTIIDDETNESERLQHLLLVATTILCPLLPWYLKQKQQHQEEEQQQVRSLLWDFIYVCMQQGRRSVVNGRECDNRGNRGNKRSASGKQGPIGNLSFVSGAGGVASMLRRRALYLLDILIETGGEQSPSTTLIWKEYVLCIETFEMEGERHIIDQIWPVVAKLVEEARKNSSSTGDTVPSPNQMIPQITPRWIELLVGRILSAEQLAVRKLGVFRLLQVLGRPVTRMSILQSVREQQQQATKISSSPSEDHVAMEDRSIPDRHNDNFSSKKKRESKQRQKQQPQKRTKKTKTSSKMKDRESTTLEVIPTEVLLTMLSPQSLLWDILVPSWDSLGGSSVGYTIHLDNPKIGGSYSSGSPVEKFARINMVPLFCETIKNYVILASTCNDDPSFSLLQWSSSPLFWKGLWNWDHVVRHLSAKTLLSIYGSVSGMVVHNLSEATAVSNCDTAITQAIPIDDDDLNAIRITFTRLFRENLMVLSHRKQFLRMLSWIISRAKLTSPPPSDTTKSKSNWSPIQVIATLTLFSSSYFPALDSEDVDWSIEKEDMLVMAGTFVNQFESQASMKDYALTVGATLATAFVTGKMNLPPIASAGVGDDDIIKSNHLLSLSGWNPVDGSPAIDREFGWAISLFCTLAVSGKMRHTSSELLWPAIYKGLSHSASVILSRGSHPKVDSVSRALLLLENGCRLRQLSGLGNGDLVVNTKTQQIMPPPPNIEQMLHNGIDFIQWHLRILLAAESHKQEESEDGYKKSKRFTGTYALLISQIKILNQSYPSSLALSNVVNELLQKSINDLQELLTGKHSSSDEGDEKKLLLVALIYGAFSCGAELEKKMYVPVIRLLMNTGLSTAGERQPRVWVKSSRSIIQFARWAAISCILPKLLEVAKDTGSYQQQDEIDRLIDDLLNEGVKSSSITPSDAIKPLFDCIIISSREWISISSKYDIDQAEKKYVETLTLIVRTLLSLFKQSTRSRESACMLNDFCALIFQNKLLREEYNRVVKDPSPNCKTPIRDGFRQLISIAGRYRPQINRAVLCRITMGWLGEESSDDRGIGAIPYREDIVKLLLHKEGKYDESSSNQSMEELPKKGITKLPSNTNYHSTTRAFLLVFFSQLPNPGSGLNSTVRKELLQYVILELLNQATPDKRTHPSLVMRGTPTYCMKMRAWQSLCVLSKFVTDEIATEVCATVFQSMNELLHNQVRYFLENFTIKCATMHPSVFGEAFLQDICRTDLSLQHISSLMIMGGNFVLGKYQLDYFTQNDDDSKSRLKRVLAGVVPWLSSTQGFSRAIAQLIVYQLIPKIIPVDDKNAATTPRQSTIDDKDWFLRSTYNFLDKNREMKRLRNKQTKFFERYDCELMSTPEGIFSIKVDEAEEADPLHLIDAMKEALRSTYEEAQKEDTPSWKHVEERMICSVDNYSDGDNDSRKITSTVQRKIIPLDSLNLALENLREQRLSNARGRHKQNLIVCASLVDKVPNLAGLARTCEIFAAQSLVLPDKSVSKMDNFQSISVGAADWIDMEEVKEEALLSWLLQKKTEGFWIVGLEQTSSSVPLHQIEIPESVGSKNKTVLLLGKEKEGIPVQFLQVVDCSVEIPQFGMIRSLNVHVSGAITIWELTRKTGLVSLDGH